MDAYRFFVGGLPREVRAGGEVSLGESESHHVRGVLRLEAGARVVVFDGAGAWAEAEVSRVSKGGVMVVIKGEVKVEERPVPRLTLATAVPKGERAEWLIEQASQLNVAAVQWVKWDRGVVLPREGGGKMGKWRRLAVESAKQCGRHWVMEVREAVGVAEALGIGSIESLRDRGIESLEDRGIEPLKDRGIEGLGRRVLWLDPGEGGVGVAEGLGAGEVSGRAGSPRYGEVVALIGPEGGWSERERGMLEAEVRAGRVRRVRLMGTVLRIETACAAVAAVVAYGK